MIIDIYKENISIIITFYFIIFLHLISLQMKFVTDDPEAVLFF